MTAKKSAAAAIADTADKPAKKTQEVKHEFVLYRRVGDDRVPVMSHGDLDVVKHMKVRTVADAFASGQAVPDLFITDRKCTYPLGASGQLLAQGSTEEETEV